MATAPQKIRLTADKQPMLKHIKQRTENDCGSAALAMACRITYERAASSLVLAQPGLAMNLSEAIKGDAANDDIVKAWLRLNGWAWQEMTRNVWLHGSFCPRHPWPPAPFAATHICFVEATKGWHYCVMDFDGRVYDPWKEERQSLDHPDYKRVSQVLGLFKIGRKCTEVLG